MLCPLDDRYADEIADVATCFSETCLIQKRVFIEINYLAHLFETLEIPHDKNELFSIVCHDPTEIKAIEKQTRHDVKAVEYWIRRQFKTKPSLQNLSHWIHFGLTSEDIDSSAYTLCFKETILKVVKPAIMNLLLQLETLGEQWQDVIILGRTHGQPATPTPLKKELLGFRERFCKQLKMFVPFTGKFGGATGNFNALYLAYPKVNWKEFATYFLKDLGLQRSQWTKQTDPRDSLAANLDCLARMCSIGIELCRDLWMYTSYGYFTFETSKNQIGSSTMPHKVNPIDFENAEGNFQLAQCFLKFIASTVTITRLQRDLSSSTILRNGGVALGYLTLALRRCYRGLSKLRINHDQIKKDLESHPEVLLEAIQTMMRKHGVSDAYEQCKNVQNIPVFIQNLNIPDKSKSILKQLTPESYYGLHL